MSEFKNLFRLDLILKSTYGSIFQLIVAILIFLQPRPETNSRYWIAAALLLVIFTQVTRMLVFWPIRKSEEKLLNHYQLFVFFSYATSFGWGVSAMISLSALGSIGVGLYTLISCSTIACGATYALAQVLPVQRIYTLFLLVPPCVGLALYSYPQLEWTTIGMLIVVVLYCFHLANKQNETIRTIYQQQERIKLDLLAAREIQQSLLPQPNQKIGDFKIEVLYQPCEDLSGDFFEIHSMKNHVLFYVADVTSHGTASAQVTFLLKGIFKKILPENESQLDLAVLTRKLAVEYSSYQLRFAVSLFLGSLNLETGRIEFVASNFPSPILLKNQKPVTLSQGSNPLIDASTSIEEYSFTKDFIELSKGESIFIFTDGTYELRSAASAQEMTYRQLSKVFSQSEKLEWQENVISELKAFSGQKDFKDDITIMRIQNQPES